MHDDFNNLMTTVIISTIDVQWFIFFFSQREKKNILELLKKRHEAQEQLFKQKLKLEQDVELEKLRKVNFIRLLWDMLKPDDQSGNEAREKSSQACRNCIWFWLAGKMVYVAKHSWKIQNENCSPYKGKQLVVLCGHWIILKLCKVKFTFDTWIKAIFVLNYFCQGDLCEVW